MSFDEDLRRMIREMKRLEEEAYSMIREIISYLETERPMWSADGSIEPLFEIYDRGDHYLVIIDLPYADLHTLNIMGIENVLKVQCRLRKDVRFERWGTVQHQRVFREYRKTIVLPEDANASKFTITRRTRSCMIEVRIPKRHS